LRAKDIVNHLSVYLPTFADDFTDQINVSSLTRSGTTITASTGSAHELSVGNQVNITGAQTPVAIVSITRTGILAEMVTSSDHDLTENAGFDVQISGANEAEFNGTFTLVGVPNRRTIQFQVEDSGPTSATGSPILLNGSNVFQTYNGLRNVTAVPTTTSFQYEVTDSTLYSPASGTIVAKVNPRISSAIDFERLLDAYTKQTQDSGWLFVVLGDAVADKNRHIDTDATDNIQSGNYYNQRLIQNVQFYVFLPTAGQIAGADARDRCQELLKPITNSVVGFKFPTLVENNNNPLMLSGHGTQAYNTAFYVHQYAFEATAQLGPSDIFDPQDDVAFRDIDLTIGLDFGTETFNTLIDLDDEPL
jgi:hypothetical protein